jgi:hypothetical protein
MVSKSVIAEETAANAASAPPIKIRAFLAAVFFGWFFITSA